MNESVFLIEYVSVSVRMDFLHDSLRLSHRSIDTFLPHSISFIYDTFQNSHLHNNILCFQHVTSIKYYSKFITLDI